MHYVRILVLNCFCFIMSRMKSNKEYGKKEKEKKVCGV